MKLGAGAFSDKEVVAAAGSILCIYVDADWGKKSKDLTSKYQVSGYPTTVFTDPDGNELAKVVGAQGADVFKAKIADAAKTRKSVAYADSWDSAVEQAKADNKPICYVFVGTGNDSKALEENFIHDSLKELREKFVFVRGELQKDKKATDEAKKYGLTGWTQPVVLVLDPNAEKPEAKPIKKWTGNKKPAEMKKELEDALKRYSAGK